MTEGLYDVRRHRPKKGQTLAQYRAVAHFNDSWLKRNLIQLLGKPTGAESTHKAMVNLVCAVEEDAIRVPLEMAGDLLAGMSEDEVAQKGYRMVVEYNFWADPGVVPADDPHWTSLKMLNDLDDRIKVTYTLPD